jgi:LPS-assembly protein
MTNRVYKKDKKGNVSEFLSWRISHARYFDPTFGNSVVEGQRTVNYVVAELTPYTFLDGPRNYSPVISSLVLRPYSFFSLEYRAAFDPLRRRFIDHTINGAFRFSKYFVSVGDTAITTDPLLVPQANQLGFGGGYGSGNRKGWNVAGTVSRDLLLRRTFMELVQASYNTDCCGFSVQLRRINFGLRDENQYLFSFSVANLGTFGSMQKQERIF